MARDDLVEMLGLKTYSSELTRNSDGVVIGGHAKSVGMDIKWQAGPIPEMGINGTTCEEVMLAVIDRLEGFQASKFNCSENAIAIHYIELAIQSLVSRTKRREAAGSKGTYLTDEACELSSTLSYPMRFLPISGDNFQVIIPGIPEFCYHMDPRQLDTNHKAEMVEELMRVAKDYVVNGKIFPVCRPFTSTVASAECFLKLTGEEVKSLYSLVVTDRKS